VSPRGPGAAVVAACLVVTAVIVALTSWAAGVVYALVAMRGGGITVVSILIVAGCVVGGLALACLLWAAAWLIATRWELLVTQRKMLSALTERRVADACDVAASVSRTGGSAGDVEHLRRAVAELLELKETMLRSPDELSRDDSAERGRRATALLGRFEEAVATGCFEEADAVAGEFAESFPDDPRGAQLRQRAAGARARAQTEDVRREVRRAEDLMALSNFPGAQEVADALAWTWPSSEEATELVERVRREAEAFGLQQRRELYDRIDRCVEGRRWREAVKDARKLLDAYPGSPEADTVASRIATLEENARIEQVRGMRDRIIDLIRRRRYAEAIGLGKEVVEKFPDTKAAGDLRAQMPRLTRLAVAKPGDINSETQWLGDILSELAKHGDNAGS